MRSVVLSSYRIMPVRPFGHASGRDRGEALASGAQPPGSPLA